MRKIIFFATTVSIFYITGRFFILYQAEKILKKEITVLNQNPAIQIRYAVLKLGPWKKNLQIEDLELLTIDSIRDTTAYLQIPAISIENIKLLKVLFYKKVSINEISIINPIIRTWQAKKIKQFIKKSNKLQHIDIQGIILKNCSWELIDSSAQELIRSQIERIEFNKLIFSKQDSNRFQISEAFIAAIKVETPKTFYRFKCPKIAYKSDNNTLKIDSFQIIPLYDKAAFAQKTGQEITRIEGTFPSIIFNGFDIASLRHKHFKARRARVQFHLDTYKDKRYPFLRGYHPLPSEMLAQSPFELSIDTLDVLDSYVSFEMIPKKGIEPGKIFFDNMNARFFGNYQCRFLNA